MKRNLYFTDRRGSEISEATENIASDCNVISFINGGDTPCQIVSADGKVKRYLDQYQEVSFGSDLPEVLERGTFTIVFDPIVTTRKVYVERARYVEQPC